ncbi:hypothetical protein HB860_11200 [Aeromonas sp. 3925]|uniref:hypothetical protein n=1 Tax=Aeromonas genomosp. paramedia TaxID=3086176 RepID=UPI001FFC7DA0|nr:hypothetical protein [Aeromonas genomosp. paramedia]MCK2084495.1 hypothetical protein [Aeromonas genomosp. paramedia]
MIDLDKVYFKSKVVGKLSSQNLIDLKNMLHDIEHSRRKLQDNVHITNENIKDTESNLAWINWFPAKLFFKRSISSKKSALLTLREKSAELDSEIKKHQLGLEIQISDKLENIFGSLSYQFNKLISIDKAWDVTTSRRTDRVVERTAANNVIERKEVRLKLSDSPKILCDYQALNFGNANGDDLHIYPQFIFMESSNDIALIDIQHVTIDFSYVNFIESEKVPFDSKIVDHAWAKSNKDGSRDKRFTDNYQIPIVRYGELHLKSKSGLNEVYMFSQPESAREFKNLFDEYKTALIKDGV